IRSRAPRAARAAQNDRAGARRSCARTVGCKPPRPARPRASGASIRLLRVARRGGRRLPRGLRVNNRGQSAIMLGGAPVTRDSRSVNDRPSPDASRTFPGGKRFALTIIDDTDVATVENLKPIYDLLYESGMRTTKTVWPVGCAEGSKNFGSS